MKAPIYHRIRDLVLEEATRPLSTHEGNKKLVRQNLETLCQRFDPTMPVDKFWYECWTHFRWAGIGAAIGTADVEAHRKVQVFACFRELASPDWDYPDRIPKEWTIDGWGDRAAAYLRGDPPYNIKGLIKNRQKLRKTIHVARKLKTATEKYGHNKYLNGIFGNNFYEEIGNESLDTIIYWAKSYNRLMTGDNIITIFHLMMDLGFYCVKPDIVLTDIFYRLGWLKEAGLPEGMARVEVRKHYRKERVYLPLQRVARQLAEEINPLFPDNAIRELDWVMVKYGQTPEPERGIVRNLDAERPVESILKEFE